jgi:hypothetical protein
MPHTSPRHVYASEYYKKDFLKFNARLGWADIEFPSLVPKLFLPTFLRDTLGYRTNVMVSLPVLNSKTILNTGFDGYKLMEKHNDMRAMVGQMSFSEEKPNFFLLNVGETHYPYALPDEPPRPVAAHQRRARRLQAPGWRSGGRKIDRQKDQERGNSSTINAWPSCGSVKSTR